MRTHIRPHAPTLTLRHACARARTHVHANTLTVCTQADADGIGGLLSILDADDSPQTTREPTLPELRVDLMQKAHAMYGGNVDFNFATQLLEVARSSPCACACMPRLAARRATGAALALQENHRDVDKALDAYGRFLDTVCMNVCTRTYTHIHTRMRTRVHAPVLCVQFQTAANIAHAADAEAAGGLRAETSRAGGGYGRVAALDCPFGTSCHSRLGWPFSLGRARDLEEHAVPVMPAGPAQVPTPAQPL